MKPELVQIKGGWAATAKTWAVFGVTQQEALAKFRESELRNEDILARPERDEVSSTRPQIGSTPTKDE